MRGRVFAAAFAAFLLPALLSASEGGDAVERMGKGKEAFEKRCRLCHSLQLPLSKQKSRTEWEASVKRMVLYGTPLGREDRGLVVSYLTARSTFEKHCNRCHSVTKVLSLAPDSDWKETVSRMAAHWKELGETGESKAEFTEEQIEEIAAFLAVIVPDN